MDDSTKRYRPANDSDARPLEEILDYNTYKFRQMKLIQEEPLSLLDTMSFQKRDAWLNIYNDYLDFINANPQTETGYEVIGEDNEPNPNYIAFSKVKSQEDFYELFRDWEIKETNVGHYQAIS